jgi:hypothetical protein
LKENTLSRSLDQMDDDEYEEMIPADIGPQCSADSPFMARMRLHQSWYRMSVLGVPCGTGPTKTSGARYGNMLMSADGEGGLNFTSPEAFTAAQGPPDAKRGAVELFKLLHNTLSTMPMCFNLFGPLSVRMDLATVAFQSLLGAEEVGRVKELKFEFSPYPPSEYLDDKTTFDAFVSYERPDGKLGFLGIETKLTEPFAQKHFDTPEYRKWVEKPYSPWPSETWDKLGVIEHNQLWRGHMLTVAMANHKRSPYEVGRFALVRHPGDTDCAKVVGRYKELLKPEDQTFIDLPLDRLIESFEKALTSDGKDWLAKFKLRYLDLAESESEWQLQVGTN